MDLLKDLSIKTKIWIVMAFAGIMSLCVMGVVLEQAKAERTNAVKGRAKSTASVVSSSVKNYVKLFKMGYMDETDARKAALENLQSIKFPGVAARGGRPLENLFVLDLTTKKILFSSQNTNIIGKDYDSYKNKKGKPVWGETLNQLKTSPEGEYFTTFVGGLKTFPHISYVHHDKDFNWLYGVGINIEAGIKAHRTNWIAVLIASAVIILFAGSLLFYMLRLISGNIDNITVNLKQISRGSGDLTKKLTIPSRDEIGLQVFWFNEFIDNMRYTIKGVKDNTVELDNAIEQVSDTAGAVRGVTKAQGDAFESTLEATKNINNSIQMVVSDVNQLSKATARARAATSNAAATSTDVAEAATHLETFTSHTVEMVNKMLVLLTRANDNINQLNTLSEETHHVANAVSEAIHSIDDEMRKHTKFTATLKDSLEEVTKTAIPNVEKVIQQSYGEIVNALSGLSNAAMLFQTVQDPQALSVASELNNIASSVMRAKDIMERVETPIKKVHDIIDSVEQNAGESVNIAMKLEHTFLTNILNIETNASSINRMVEMTRTLKKGTDEQTNNIFEIETSVKKLNELAHGLKRVTVEQDKENKLIAESVEEIHALAEVILGETSVQEQEAQNIAQAAHNASEWLERGKRADNELALVVNTLNTTSLGLSKRISGLRVEETEPKKRTK